MKFIEHYGNATVVWSIGVFHELYEDCSKVWNYSNSLVKRSGKGEILVVCDGVSSAPKGKEAAQIICQCLEKFFISKELASAHLVAKTLEYGNEQVRNLGLIEEYKPIGTCAGTVAWISEERQLHIFHVGDTKLILIRKNSWITLTKDHQNESGHLNNFYGRPEIQFEYKKLDIIPGDKVLIFSDGISKVLSDKEIVSIIVQFKSRSAALSALEHKARTRGSLDDITAILYEEEEF